MPGNPPVVRSRRAVLGGLAAAAGVLSSPAAAPAATPATPAAAAGRLKQSVCRWPYKGIPLPAFCRRAKQTGFAAVDLLYMDEWAIAQ
jgi:hydroxypyruvate isomerase